MTESWTRIRHLFRAASELEPSEWEPYLDSACPDDAGLRDRVLQLLREQDRNDAFLEAPAMPLATPDGDDLRAGKRIGPYEVVRVIARGGMGVVYEARDVRLDKVVALKTMHPLLARNPTVRQRFEQEARTLARLEDPHVVRIHALQDEGSDTFIVMEYVQGPTLAEFLRRRGRLSPKETLFLARQLLTALSKAHRLDIVHRDLKPANVMLARDDEGRPLVKVLDFGIAKQLGGRAQTMTQGAIGTLLYMAPEQVRGNKDIDGRADLYALGVMLYEMLAGELPYERRSDEYTLRRQIVEDPIEPLHVRQADIPTGLSDVVQRALAKNPEDRFATAEEMLRALVAFEQPRREPAPLPSSPPQTRNRQPVLWGAIGAISTVIGIVYFLVRPPAPADSAALPSISEAQVSVDSMTQAQPIGRPDTLGSHLGGAELVSLPATEPQTASNDPGNSARQPDPPPELLTTDPNATTKVDSVLTPAAGSGEAEVPPPPSRLQLAISPSGDLFLNETKVIGGAAMNEIPVNAGTYAARVVNTTYGEWQCEITVETSQPLTLTVDFLTPVYVIIAAEDEATGKPLTNADIYIDDIATQDKTPQTIRLQPGVRRIEARLPGYLQIDIRPDSPAGCYQRLGTDSVNFDRYAFGERTRVVARLKKEG